MSSLPRDSYDASQICRAQGIYLHYRPKNNYMYLFATVFIGRLKFLNRNSEIKLSRLPLEDFYFSDKALYSFQLMFQINKSKIKLKKDLDTFIRQAASNGLLKSIESKYR